MFGFILQFADELKVSDRAILFQEILESRKYGTVIPGPTILNELFNLCVILLDKLDWHDNTLS